MIYDLDTVVDRHGTNCCKFDLAKECGIPEDNLSLWVADMDFPVAEPIKEALHKAVDHGIFGYSAVKEDYYQAVTSWYGSNFGWNVKKEWIVLTPGVVFALATAVRAFTEPGDKVLIQQPVYYPFRKVVVNNGREVVNSPLVFNGEKYEINFEDLETKLKDPALKMMLFCSPHNPVSRVWTKEELKRVAELCLCNDVILICDEIHSDFVWGGRTHYVMTSLDERYEKNTVICTAPSKTFNLAGLQLSNIMIADPNLRKKYKDFLNSGGFDLPNQFGMISCKAAYEHGKEWLDQVRSYICENIAFTKAYLKDNMPKLKLIETEGTYLMWVDCRELGMDKDSLEDFIINKAHLWLDGGAMFGEEGAGFQRINAACSRTYLKQALDQLKQAYDEL